MNECCKNCKYFVDLIPKKANGLPDYKNKKKCCYVFCNDGAVYEVNGSWMCECFKERIQRW